MTTNPDKSLLVELPDKKVTIMPDGKTQVFSRNGIRVQTGEHIRWLVCELDGVRLYVNGDNMVMTKRDMYP